MAKNLPLLLFFTMLTLSYSISISAPSPPPSPPPPDQDTHQQQLNNIIDALIGSGDFATWANMLSDMAASSTAAATATTPRLPLPLSATIFVPEDDALSAAADAAATSTTTARILDPYVFPYHIVPQRLSFSDLLLFKTRSRLPTLSPNKSILITNNSRSNFTVDDVPITYPDLYSSPTIAVHGVAAVLDYSVYGGDVVASHHPKQPFPPGIGKPPPRTFLPAGEIVEWRRSGATCLCTEFMITVLSVVCAVLAFKIQRNYSFRSEQ